MQIQDLILKNKNGNVRNVDQTQTKSEKRSTLPLDTHAIPNVHKSIIWHYERHMNVLCIFNLDRIPTDE